MGVVATDTMIPQGGVPELAMIAKLRKGMAGCAGCLDGMGDPGGLGEDVYDPYTGSWIGSSTVPVSGVPTTPGGGGNFNWGPWLQDLTRITGSIASNVLSPPVYRTQTTPSGSLTEIRTGGGINYPGGLGPTKSGTGLGLDTGTLLLLGVGVIGLFMMSRR
jgi:hypothetical protein